MRKIELDSLFGVVLYLALFFYFLVPWIRDVDFSFLKSEIKVYPVACWETEADCTKALPSITFKIDAENQRVVFYNDAGNLGMLNDCVIRNRKNWYCPYSLNYQHPLEWFSYKAYKNGSLGFKEGVYFDTSTPGNPSYVSKSDWRAVKSEQK